MKTTTQRSIRFIVSRVFLTVLTLNALNTCFAHHVLGRPAYSLNEASNTPPSMAVETQIGDYFVTYMVFPAFPKPGEYGRLNLYASRIDNGRLFGGEVEFYVRDDSLFSDKDEFLGRQNIDDGVYRQGFVFSNEGSYVVSARFLDQGEPYVIDFPLQVGQRSSAAILSAAIFGLMALLLTVNIIHRKRLQTAKIQSERP